MAEPEHEQVQSCDVDDDEAETPNFVPPAPKSLQEITTQDSNDESLNKYKQALLGGGLEGNVVVDESNPKKVIVTKLSMLADDRDEVSIDLTKSLDEIKKEKFVIKEGCKYRIKVYFYVQRDIVSGLRYMQTINKKIIKVDKSVNMIGSYGPSKELRSFTTGEEDAPSGLMARGDYLIKSKFIDDDKIEYLNWEWNLSIKKDW